MLSCSGRQGLVRQKFPFTPAALRTFGRKKSKLIQIYSNFLQLLRGLLAVQRKNEFGGAKRTLSEVHASRLAATWAAGQSMQVLSA